MTATLINLETWPRRDTCALFRRFQKPHFAITARVEINALMARRARDPAFSSYLACMHAMGAALQAVPELRSRIRGETVVQHDGVRLSPTLQFEDGRLGFAYLTWQPDFAGFAAYARAEITKVIAAQKMVPGIEESDDEAYLSCMPWLDFTALDNPVLNADDSIPRLAWGRYTETAPGRWSMAVSLQAHHGLADGLHVVQFFKALQAALDGF